MGNSVCLYPDPDDIMVFSQRGCYTQPHLHRLPLTVKCVRIKYIHVNLTTPSELYNMNVIYLYLLLYYWANIQL